MCEHSSIINDIKLVENFSYMGCYYSKAEDGSVSRNCDEMRAFYEAKREEQLAEGTDPKKVAQEKQRDAEEIAAKEADVESTLAEYNEVVGVQTAIINFFAKNIDSIREAEVKSVDEAECMSDKVCTKIVSSYYVIDFSDSDADGRFDGIKIGPNPARIQFGNMNYIEERSLIHSFAWTGYPDAYASNYKTWLYGDDFAPLLSALFALNVE